MKKIKLIFWLFIVINTSMLFAQQYADQMTVSLYEQLLNESGENLGSATKENYNARIQDLLKEIYEIQNNLKEYYNILKVLGYVNKDNITELEFRTYKENFFERKEMEVFTEYLRIEWKDNVPQWIIFRSRSSFLPKLNTKNTIFVLPKVDYETSQSHNQDKNVIDPMIHVFASIAYSAGLGERYHFVFPNLTQENSNIQVDRNSVQIYDYVLKDIPYQVIADHRLKFMTLQYLVYRLRYLDLKIRGFAINKIKKNQYDFYRSIPDSRY
ncbi:MAG: hypothetical protein ACK42K_07815 [Leptonema sp. (in: bacteria)]|jgi:hypothetical protein